MSEEKIVTGIDEVEAGFTAEPEVSAIEQVGIDSFIAGVSEVNADLKDAGINVPESEKQEVPVSDTAIGIEGNSFTAEPELSPIEKIEADGYIAGKEEINSELEAAGIEIPAAEEKKPVPVSDTAIGLEETGFNAVPELSPLEQLDVDSYVSSPAEIEDDMKKAGID